MSPTPRHPPWLDVTALLHEGAQREPETVEDGEVVGHRRPVRVVLDVPLERTEAAYEEQHDTDADVGEDDTHPYLVGEREEEREHARCLLRRLRDHDADAETHERLREVDDSLADRRDGQRRDGEVGLLEGRTRQVGSSKM